jgi:hypothetical protein
VRWRLYDVHTNLLTLFIRMMSVADAGELKVPIAVYASGDEDVEEVSWKLLWRSVN